MRDYGEIQEMRLIVNMPEKDLLAPAHMGERGYKLLVYCTIKETLYFNVNKLKATYP